MHFRALIIALLAALPCVGQAQSAMEAATVELLPGWREDSGDHVAALRISMEPGWVTYWRAPGDGGIPPQFDFKGDAVIGTITPHWPVPKVFDYDGMISIGYDGTVVLPLRIDLTDNPGAVLMAGEVTIGVCKDVCIPVSFAFETLLPSVSLPDPVIRRALANYPTSGAEAGVGQVICQIDPISDGLQLQADITIPQGDADDYVVIETADPYVWVSQSDITQSGSTLTATVDLVAPSGQPFALDRSGIRFTVLGTNRAIDILGCSAP